MASTIATILCGFGTLEVYGTGYKLFLAVETGIFITAGTLPLIVLVVFFSKTYVLKYLTLDKLISLSGGLLYTFIAFILGYQAAFIAVEVFKVRPGRRGTMINTFVNANTIFIGLPLNIALFGNQALPYFLVYYITNTVSTWTFGVYLMTSDSKEGASKQAQKYEGYEKS